MTLIQDKNNLPELLSRARDIAAEFLAGVDERPVQSRQSPRQPLSLPDDGIGAENALSLLVKRYGDAHSGSAGPRYWGFVTGGATPAALVGDWLASAYDQNGTQGFESAAQFIETETIAMLCDLFNLPGTFTGNFVSGATMSNFAGLAMARQWIAHQCGIDIAADGFYGLRRLHIISSTPHSSAYKALAMLGLGRNNVSLIPQLPDRESMDVAALETYLAKIAPTPAIVIASAGTVNTVDFDDLRSIAALKERFNFWLHVDGAFGGFAAVSPKYRYLMEGIEAADSICIDAHKWLNVPYDSAMFFTRHPDLQLEVFQSAASYLGVIDDNPDFVHLTPQNSRRLRALPAWMTLMAYGRDGYREMVERNCLVAGALGERIRESSRLRLLAPVRMNVVCFTLDGAENATVDEYLNRVNAAGKVLMTPTVYDGQPGIRAAISNWRTTLDDLDIAWESMMTVLDEMTVKQS